MNDRGHHDAVLRARARELAKPLQALDAGGTGEPLLAVRVGRERVAIALAAVVEVTRNAAVTPVPRATPPVAGAVAWRGRALAVLAFGSAVGRSVPWLVVVGGARRALCAVAVDEVMDTITLDSEAVRELGRRTVAGTGALPLSGVTSDGIGVVDVARLVRLFDNDRGQGTGDRGQGT